MRLHVTRCVTTMIMLGRSYCAAPTSGVVAADGAFETLVSADTDVM